MEAPNGQSEVAFWTRGGGSAGARAKGELDESAFLSSSFLRNGGGLSLLVWLL